MQNMYVFPAVFENGSNNYSIYYPDLPGCISAADNTEEAYRNAREVLELHLFGMEEEGYEIPEPTPVSEIKLDENESVALIDVNMPMVRAEMNDQTVTVNTTMPLSLKRKAEYAHINFSQTLQHALIQKLNLNT